MMVHPEKYVEQFYEAGADIITVHAEATQDAPALMQQITDLGAAAGIAVNPDTPVTDIEAALPFADLALVMSVHAGFGGQKFIEPVLEKYEQIRSLPGGEDVLLEIDGGINADTIAQATDHGAQLLVAGSAVFKKDNYSDAIAELMSEVNVTS